MNHINSRDVCKIFGISFVAIVTVIWLSALAYHWRNLQNLPTIWRIVGILLAFFVLALALLLLAHIALGVARASPRVDSIEPGTIETSSQKVITAAAHACLESLAATGGISSIDIEGNEVAQVEEKEALASWSFTSSSSRSLLTSDEARSDSRASSHCMSIESDNVSFVPSLPRIFGCTERECSAKNTLAIMLGELSVLAGQCDPPSVKALSCSLFSIDGSGSMQGSRECGLNSSNYGSTGSLYMTNNLMHEMHEIDGGHKALPMHIDSTTVAIRIHMRTIKKYLSNQHKVSDAMSSNFCALVDGINSLSLQAPAPCGDDRDQLAELRKYITTMQQKHVIMQDSVKLLEEKLRAEAEENMAQNVAFMNKIATLEAEKTRLSNELVELYKKEEARTMDEREYNEHSTRITMQLLEAEDQIIALNAEVEARDSYMQEVCEEVVSVRMNAEKYRQDSLESDCMAQSIYDEAYAAIQELSCIQKRLIGDLREELNSATYRAATMEVEISDLNLRLEKWRENIETFLVTCVEMRKSLENQGTGKQDPELMLHFLERVDQFTDLLTRNIGMKSVPIRSLNDAVYKLDHTAFDVTQLEPGILFHASSGCESQQVIDK